MKKYNYLTSFLICGFIHLGFLSTSFADDHIEMVSAKIGKQEIKMLCQPANNYHDDVEFIIVNDDGEEGKEKEENITSELKAAGDVASSNIFECHRGSDSAVVYKKTKNQSYKAEKSKQPNQADEAYEMIAKINDRFYVGIVPTPKYSFPLVEIQVGHSDKPEDASCNHNPENQENIASADEELDLFNENMSFEDLGMLDNLSDRYGPVQNMIPNQSSYVMYLDVVFDQYFLNNLINPNLDQRVRLRLARNMFERRLVINNVLLTSELNLQFKIKRIYAYFGGSKFHQSVNSVREEGGHTIFDDMDDFFENRPKFDRAFALLVSGIGRNANGAADSDNPICSDEGLFRVDNYPGQMWVRMLSPNESFDIDEIANSYNNMSDALIVLPHEFTHLTGRQHNNALQYNRNYDCCELAHNLGVPIPEERDQDYVINPEDEERLRSCMDSSFGRRENWQAVETNYLLNNVYTGGIMSAGTEGNRNYCVNRKAIFVERNLRHFSHKLDFYVDHQLGGTNNSCAYLEENTAPRIRNIEQRLLRTLDDQNIYQITVDAIDPDQELFQVRGANGEVFNGNTILYEVRTLSGNPQFFQSMTGEVQAVVPRGLQIVEVRAYDNKGAYASRNIPLVPESALVVMGMDNINEIPLDTSINFSVAINGRYVQRDAEGNPNYPEIPEEIELVIDYYGDGNDVQNIPIESLNDLAGQMRTFNYVYSRSGNFNLVVTLRIGEYEAVLEKPIVVLANANPEISYFRIGDSEYIQPMIPTVFDVNIIEENLYQNTQIRINFGDGHIEDFEIRSLGEFQRDINRSSQIFHTYQDPGVYRVLYEVSDGKGGNDMERRELRVAVGIQVTSSEFPQVIIPGEEAIFRVQANTNYDRARLRFVMNFGDGQNTTIVVPVAEARNGVVIPHVYQNLMTGSSVNANLTITSEVLTHNPPEISQQIEIGNARPIISYMKFFIPLSEEEIAELDQNQVNIPLNPRGNNGGGGQFQQAGAVENQRAGKQTVTFYLRFNDANGPMDNLSINWRFSDNFSSPQNQVYLDNGYLKVDYNFREYNQNQWGEVEICDSFGSCATRRIELTEQNRRTAEENLNDGVNSPEVDMNIQVDNPFGF